MRCFFAILAVLSLSAPQWAVAASGESTPSRKLIPNSYVVMFKPTGGGNVSPIVPLVPAEKGQPLPVPPFGEHGTGQNKAELARSLNINGTVAKIFTSINAAHLRIDAAEAERLSRDPRVSRVDQDSIEQSMQTTQGTPGWALDRLDQATAPLNNAYTYSANGAGQTVYVLDSGLALNHPNVAAEFGSRATIFWDVNYENKPIDSMWGQDCSGESHGTGVASALGGNTHGVAKGATLVIVKINVG